MGWSHSCVTDLLQSTSLSLTLRVTTLVPLLLCSNKSVYAESKVSDCHHLSELRIRGLGCSQQRLQNSTPDDQGFRFMLRNDSASSGRASWECCLYEYCVFRIYSRINNFYVYAFYRNPGHDGSLYDCLSQYSQLMIQLTGTVRCWFNWRVQSGIDSTDGYSQVLIQLTGTVSWW